MKIPLHLEGLSKRDLIRRCLFLEERVVTLEYLEQRVIELEKRLLAYENAHTPPSQQREKKYPQRTPTGNPVGAQKGHPGTTRQKPTPTETKTLTLQECPQCHNALGTAQHIRRRVIEELPDPQPLRIIEFFIYQYHCAHCQKEVIPSHQELPKQGIFGNNLQAQIVLMSKEERLPLRKIAEVLNRQYGLRLTPASIEEVLGRVADILLPQYKQLKKRIKKAKIVYADETGAKLNGKKHWLWAFITRKDILYLLRKKRDHYVVEEVLKNFLGILVSDGYKAYPQVIKLIQRCWAHLLREAKLLAQKHEGQARTLYKNLAELFKTLKEEIPIHARQQKFNDCMKQMQSFVNTANAYQYLRKFATTIMNGMNEWFTCILYPNVEPTNNRAERALREFVVQRKIFGTFRSEKGMKTTEILLSMLATWKLQGLNTYDLLRQTLSS